VPKIGPEVSVLLVSWNTRELTSRCLDSLPVAADDDVAYEVIVVENGSVDGSAELLGKRSDIRLLKNQENRGYAAAVNQAFAVSNGAFLLLLNSDIVFRPGSLSILVGFLRERTDVAGVGPAYLNPDGSPQQHYYRLPGFWTLLSNSNGLLRRLPPLARSLRAYRMIDDDFSQPRQVEQPSASCLLLRRSCVPGSKIYDERFPIYFNDVALARRLAHEGRQLWMTPASTVVHEHGAATSLLGASRRRHYLATLVRYLKETEPRRKVIAFQAVLFAQGLVMRISSPGDSLTISDLLRAVRGEPGPLPQAPSSA
jgi:GT2 family glycosyltransferase